MWPWKKKMEDTNNEHAEESIPQQETAQDSVDADPPKPVMKEVIYQVLTIYYNGTRLGWESRAKSTSDHRFMHFVNWYKKGHSDHYYFKSNRDKMPSTTMLRRDLITSWATHFEVRNEFE